MKPPLDILYKKACDDRIAFCMRRIAVHEGKAQRQLDYVKYYKRELAVAQIARRRLMKSKRRTTR